MKYQSKRFSQLTADELYEILKIRSQIFIVELGMHCHDVDGVDPLCTHCYLEEDGKILAYLRSYPAPDSGNVLRIGRVLSTVHGQGLGRSLLEAFLHDVKKSGKYEKICLDSQKHAVGFYEKLGFKVVSGEFMEEGVLHVAMQLDI